MSLISPQYVNRLELRIAELEAENLVCRNLGQKQLDRAEAAEAKLARVREWLPTLRRGCFECADELEAALQGPPAE